MHRAINTFRSTALLAAGVLGTLVSGCGCGQDQSGSLTVYITDDQYWDSLDDNGTFSHETCISICERQDEFDTVDRCEINMVEPAAGVDTGGSSTPVWTLECHGKTKLVCL